MFRAFVLLVLGTFPMCGIVTAQEQSASTLLTAARSKSNIFDQGPFLLIARYRATDDPRFEGQYGLVWVSKDQWREEIIDPTGNSIRIGNGETTWSMRTSPRPTALAQDLQWLVGFQSRLATRPEIKFEKVRSEKQKGMVVQCVQLRYADTRDKVCFDPASRLSTTKYDEYSDYRVVGKAEFPFLLVSKSPHREIRVMVQKIELNPSVRPEFFAVDSRFESARGCYAPQSPLTLRTTPPHYPQSAKAARVQGRVTANVLLNESGAVTDVQLVYGHPMLAPEALQALRNWKFAPAYCDGAPIPSSVIVEITFTMSGESFPPSPPRL